MATAKVTSIKERARDSFQMHESDFGEDVNREIEHWLFEQIRVRKEQLRQLFENKAPEWRRIARGQPMEEAKSWPFENCSNLVYQLVGQSIDDLCARVLGFIYATSPMQFFSYYANQGNQDSAIQNEKKARILEQFFDTVGYEPAELDLYRHDSIWLADSAKLGIAWVKAIPEERVEAVVIGYDSQAKKIEGEDRTIYKGPKVANVEFEDVLFVPEASCPEESDIIIHHRSLTRKQLEDRVAMGFYDEETVKPLWERPDRHGPSEIVKREERREGITEQEDSVLAEWDVYECWFAWRYGTRKYRLIWTCHYDTRTVLKRVFNFMPDNDLALIRTKIDGGSNGILGDGFSEMLDHYQQEISTMKNQRSDATMFGMLGVNRISPRNKNIDRYFQLFPGATAPFEKDDFEHIRVGNAQMVAASMQNEEQIIQQARERTGIGPAVAGAGAGQGKIGSKGQMSYGSMGTMAVLQDSNTRIANRTSDFRHARVKLAGLLTKMYGKFGLGQQGTMFGSDQEILMEALQDYLHHRVRIPIRSSSASLNKEVEKQNGILLSQHLVMYQKNVIQMLQAMENPQLPPFAKDFFASAIKSLVSMERRLLRDFGYEQPEEFAPEPKLQEAANAGTQPPQGIAQMAAAIQRHGIGQGNAPVPGMGEPVQGPPGTTGGGGIPPGA